MKKISYNNLKKLSYGDEKLFGDNGVWAEANKNGTISFKIMKRIKKVNNIYLSPFRGTLGYYPQMSIKQAEEEARKVIKLCNEGIHPRKGAQSKEKSKLHRKPMEKKIIIIGAGGHATSILNIIYSLNYKVKAFVDNTKTSKSYNNIKVIDDKEAISKYYDYNFIVGVGDNYIREKIYKKYSKAINNIKFVTLIHKSAVISWNAEIEIGSVIMPNTTVGPNSKVGKFCILNTNASIDHDSLIGNFSSLAPGVNAGGGVQIGKNSFIGIGAKIKNNIKIGDDVIVGAASYVNSDIENNVICYGVPSRVKKKILKNNSSSVIF